MLNNGIERPKWRCFEQQDFRLLRIWVKLVHGWRRKKLSELERNNRKASGVQFKLRTGYHPDVWDFIINSRLSLGVKISVESHPGHFSFESSQ